MSVFEPLAAVGFADIPINNDYLLSIALPVEVARFLSDADRSGQLYNRLLPYSGLVVDTAEFSTGAVDRSLGLAAWTAGKLDDAERHLTDALQQKARIGAAPWTAQTQRDLAKVVLIRDSPGDHETAMSLLRSALDAADRLGISRTAARIREELSVWSETGPSVPVVTVSTRTATSALFRREGEYWSMSFERGAFRLKDAKGLHYLSHLLQHRSGVPRTGPCSYRRGRHTIPIGGTARPGWRSP
jgi:hypothetical protein